MSYSELFQKDNKKVAFSKAKTVTYTVGFSSLLEVLASSLSYETKRLTNDSQTRSIEPDVMRDYLKTLLEMRLARITGKSLGEHRSGHYSYMVPTIVSTLLSQVGIAYDATKGINYMPKDSNKSFTLNMVEMVNISNLLVPLESEGMKLTKGSPKATDGNVGYLSIQTVNNSLCSYRTDDYINGFWAALLNVKWVEAESDFISDLQNNYGEISEYVTYIPKLISMNA